MLFAESLLAIHLLTGTAATESIDPAFLRACHPTLRLALIRVAIEEEILDPRETCYIFARPEHFMSDLHMLRQRHEELADAPPLSDAYRFPEQSVVNDLLVFNRAYANYIDLRRPMELTRSADLHTTQREVDYLFHIWDTVRDVRCEFYYVAVRRHVLKRLRDLLGEEAYYRAELPPHVPLWRFHELD